MVELKMMTPSWGKVAYTQSEAVKIIKSGGENMSFPSGKGARGSVIDTVVLLSALLFLLKSHKQGKDMNQTAFTATCS